MVRVVRYTADERDALVLLFLPFLLVASAMVFTAAFRHPASQGIPVAAIQAPAAEPDKPVARRELSAAGLHISRPPRQSLIPFRTELKDVPAVDDHDAAELPLPLPPRESVAQDGTNGVCVAEARTDQSEELSGDTRPFGLRLAAAARQQLETFVVYNDSYRTISYPMGDVPPFFGVCTDVVVRAYRALGIDLQRLVHEARAGSGDSSIDHRRTEVLRRFFALHGTALPVSDFAEDYRPGDIVTYYRPQNRGSSSHIAIVADAIAVSGRPMIIHNRGWGPQMEDALFVDRITGHFRYSGPAPSDIAGFQRNVLGGRVIKASFAPSKPIQAGHSTD